MYTKEDCEELIDLSRNFQFFLKKVGLDSDNEIVSILMSDDKTPIIPRQGRAYVDAWVAWSIHFSEYKNILWESKRRKNDPSVCQRVRAIVADIDGKFLPDYDSVNINRLDLSNGSRLLASKPTTDASRGLSLQCIVLEDVTPKSPLWIDIMQALLPSLACDTGSRIITLLPDPELM